MAKGKAPQPYARKTTQHFAADDLKKVMAKVFAYRENDAAAK
jgi:hypothetical protein